MIDVTVNGEVRRVEAGISVDSLLQTLGIEARGLAVAVGDEVVPRSAWTRRALDDGDRVEILTIAQGG